ncbi:MAG: RNA polymerase sigma factor [Deltaproteobacteria bacterium]|nr:RNA polymerase sigma factor [Deltaproteobacteria bacterium]
MISKANDRDMGQDISQLQDIEIIRRVLDGNLDAFEVIMDRYQDQVFRLVSKHIPHDRRKEVAHDAFVQAYTSLSTYTATGPLAHWLSKIAVRCCYDYWRESHRSAEMTISSITEDHQTWLDHVLLEESSDAHKRETAHREAKEILDWALARLTPEERMVVTLTHLDGFPVKEAADLLGWSVIKVKVQAHRSRQKLRQLISTLLPDEGKRHEKAK